ncbi:MAG: heavy metal-associated domain-containing protein [Burkholderiaceae bacterium]|nr:heavy metal-associated domain-containing protein [Burkholderiaceae bacterium]
MNTIDLEVQGMSCGSCVNHVTRALKPIHGVDDIAVDRQSGHVRVSGTIDIEPERLVSALSAAGYPTKLADVSASPSPARGPTDAPRKGQGGCCCH